MYCLQEATMESKLAVNEGCALELHWKTTHDSFRVLKNLIVNVPNVEKQNIQNLKVAYFIVLFFLHINKNIIQK